MITLLFEKKRKEKRSKCQMIHHKNRLSNVIHLMLLVFRTSSMVYFLVDDETSDLSQCKEKISYNSSYEVFLMQWDDSLCTV